MDTNLSPSLNNKYNQNYEIRMRENTNNIPITYEEYILNRNENNKSCKL